MFVCVWMCVVSISPSRPHWCAGAEAGAPGPRCPQSLLIHIHWRCGHHVHLQAQAGDRNKNLDKVRVPNTLAPSPAVCDCFPVPPSLPLGREEREKKKAAATVASSASSSTDSLAAEAVADAADAAADAEDLEREDMGEDEAAARVLQETTAPEAAERVASGVVTYAQAKAEMARVAAKREMEAQMAQPQEEQVESGPCEALFDFMD